MTSVLYLFGWILLVLVLLLEAICIVPEYQYKQTKIYKAVQKGLTYTTIVWMLISLYASIAPPKYKVVEHGTFNLTAVADNLSIKNNHGKRFLIQQDHQLNYIVQNADESYNMYSAPVNKSVIYETTESPKVVLDKFVFDFENANFIQKLYRPVYESDNYTSNKDTICRYKFYIPEGTIMTEFKIDLEN